MNKTSFLVMFKLHGFPEKEVICDSLNAGIIQCLSTLALPPRFMRFTLTQVVTTLGFSVIHHVKVSSRWSQT